ncbi:MAG: XisI protein [Calothrix sp. MO_167.B12]|nr:XisI protein [Calothrix sp. MO_167.B12]
MDNIKKYRQIIQRILTEYASIPYTYGELKTKLIISQDLNNYLLITQGWENDVRVHGCLVDIEIIDGKIWIQRDGTEYGVANELVLAGVLKDDIVIGFQPPELRPFVEYAE